MQQKDERSIHCPARPEAPSFVPSGRALRRGGTGDRMSMSMLSCGLLTLPKQTDR